MIGLCWSSQRTGAGALRACAITALALCAALIVVAPAVADNGSGVGRTEFSCTHVTFTFEGFANAPGNTVQEVVSIGGSPVGSATFTFDGPTGSNTIPIVALPGRYVVDAHAKWNTNGVAGAFDHHAKVRCTGGFTVTKLQKIEGSGGEYTTAELKAKIGQVVDYQIVAENTGEVPLTFSDLVDPECEAGTVEGGSSSPIPPGGTVTYTCRRSLPAVATFKNVATVTGTPEEGPASTESSNEVVVVVPPEPAFSLEKLQRAGGEGPYTTEPLVEPVETKIEYEIIATNTGNVPLGFSDFKDANCEAIAGGPGAGLLLPGESTVWTCSHVLSVRNVRHGAYPNDATVTGTPPAGDGSAVTNTSNTVVAYGPMGGANTGFSCSSVTFEYAGFPNLEGNEVLETIRVDGTVVVTKTFTFNGPSATDTIPLELGEGKFLVDARTTWKTNGVFGGTDQHANVRCGPAG